MKNNLLFLILLASSCNISAQNKIAGYEYWFNSDFAAKTLTHVSPVQQLTMNLTISTTGLSPGLHSINFRSIDNTKKWSSTVSQFFYKVPQSITSATNVVAYQYWFNSDFTNAVTVNTPLPEIVYLDQIINVQTLNNGLQSLNIRFKDNGGMWSSTLSQFFFKVPQTTIDENKIIAYRYWFNESFDQATDISVTTPGQTLIEMSNITLTGIPNGKYAIHFQFKDKLGMWSVVTSDSINMMSTVDIPENTFENSIVVYPNPTNGNVYIDLGTNFKETEVKIMDANGKLVQQSIYNNLQTIELNINGPSGIYVITIASGNKMKTLRLVKK